MGGGVFAFVFVMYLYCDVFVMGMYFGQAKVYVMGRGSISGVRAS